MCQAGTLRPGTGWSRSFEFSSPHLQEARTVEGERAGFEWAFPASEPMCCAALAPQQHCPASGQAPSPPCLLVCSLAGLPGRPGTPEIPQKYKNTVLVLWKPAESKAPCTYTLERRLDGTWGCLPPTGATAWKPGLTWGHHARTKMPNVLVVPWRLVGSRVRDGRQGAAPALPSPHLAPTLAGEHEWKIVSTGIADCYFNVTELPPGSTAKFRVACVNKAGQGPYSTPSGKVHLEAAGEQVLSCKAWGWMWGCGLWGVPGVLESVGIFPPVLWGTTCTPLLAYTSLCSLQMPKLPQPRTSLSPSSRRWLPVGPPRRPWGSWSRQLWELPPPHHPASTREWG